MRLNTNFSQVSTALLFSALILGGGCGEETDDPPGLITTPDRIPPEINEVFPEPLQAKVPLNISVKVYFNEPIDATTLDSASFNIIDDLNRVPEFRVEYEPDSLLGKLVPVTKLRGGVLYTVSLASTVTDLQGNKLPPLSWLFMPINSDSALYRATFEAYWSQESHPADFPSGAHFTGLIGMTHNELRTLFEPGQLSTEGIKDMAELGSKRALTDEIKEYKAALAAQTIISGGGVSPSPGSVSEEFCIDVLFPRVSITSMVAPSPDWFVLISNVDLHPRGTWLSDTTIMVGIYDAGTDSGPSYTSPNQVTDPAEVIRMITEPPLGSNGSVAPLGTIRFERVE